MPLPTPVRAAATTIPFKVGGETLGSQYYLLRRIWGIRPSERTFSVSLVSLAFTACSKLAGFVRGSPRGAFLPSALLPGSLCLRGREGWGAVFLRRPFGRLIYQQRLGRLVCRLSASFKIPHSGSLYKATGKLQGLDDTSCKGSFPFLLESNPGKRILPHLCPNIIAASPRCFL